MAGSIAERVGNPAERVGNPGRVGFVTRYGRRRGPCHAAIVRRELGAVGVGRGVFRGVDHTGRAHETVIDIGEMELPVRRPGTGPHREQAYRRRLPGLPAIAGPIHDETIGRRAFHDGRGPAVLRVHEVGSAAHERGGGQRPRRRPGIATVRRYPDLVAANQDHCAPIGGCVQQSHVARVHPRGWPWCARGIAAPGRNARWVGARVRRERTRPPAAPPGQRHHRAGDQNYADRDNRQPPGGCAETQPRPEAPPAGSLKLLLCHSFHPLSHMHWRHGRRGAPLNLCPHFTLEFAVEIVVVHRSPSSFGRMDRSA